MSYSAGHTSYSRDRFCWLPANDLHRQTKSHMKGNVVTKLLGTLNFKFNVTDTPVTIPLQLTVLLAGRRRTRPIVPLSDDDTCSPIGPTAGRGHRTGRHPEVTPRDGGPSPGIARIERTRAHARAHANVPLSVGTPTGRDTIGTARERTHTSLTSSLRPARWPTIGLTRLHDRLPLLAASACRARAQLKLQPAKPLHSIDSAGRIDTARRATACALRCSFSAARCGRGHLDRVNERLHSSSTIGSRRRIFLWAGMRLQTSVLMLADRKVDKSRGRAQEGGDAKQRPSLQYWSAITMSESSKVQGSADVYRV